MNNADNTTSELIQLLAVAISTLIESDVARVPGLLVRRLDQMAERLGSTAEANMLRQTVDCLSYAQAMKRRDFDAAVRYAQQGLARAVPGTSEHHTLSGELIKALCSNGDRLGALLIVRDRLSQTSDLLEIADVFRLMNEVALTSEEIEVCRRDVASFAAEHFGLTESKCTELGSTLLQHLERMCRQRGRSN